MKKLLNTVYVTTEGAALRKDGENLVAEVEGEVKARVPLHMIASVVAFGPVLVSPALIGACAVAGITLVLLDRAGRFQARGSFFTMAGRWAIEAIVARVAQAPLSVAFAFPIAAPGEASGLLNPLTADEPTRAAGRLLYQTNCAACHGAAGKGR